MSDPITNVNHANFKYIFIPQDIEDPVEVREYAGNEGSFQALMKVHFSMCSLNTEQKKRLNHDLTAEAKKQAGNDENNNPSKFEQFENIADFAQNQYQIIPLSLPTKTNKFEAVNAYIDNVGRFKGLKTNARASRVTSDDICGDCFISRTFDDEEIFKRIDFDLKDYERFLEEPPSKTGRWSAEKAMQLASSPATSSAATHCQNCFKERCMGIKLSKCGNCRKVAYCSVDCQKADWPYHKRMCAA
eukprot:Gregarina_sp_Poly_1__11163@NODE_909_length_5750_cov_103_012845_g648_i0_p4_GENE_NODE_909_length_5750_cov_103_012845_g648_i0NODE_909_length_5750_cov_103_012845_g648_i0_p4_ORF_typecomplete_len245_score27_10zfMYND/PF01753_18/1_4e04zfMYND/PF01753_18/1_1e11zfC6H2/PF15801_5/0_68Meleagrin/PF08189_11/1_4e04Meleagrin/PF08189_11/0_11_NODE_909_length_5750_cov_103_012845_g648_i023533087